MSERCQHADTVAAYLLGALPDEERRAFEAHLADCAHCREDVAEPARSPPTRCRWPSRRSRRRRRCASA